jgi:hypothetical protein
MPVELRVLRGGSFNNNDRNVRCAYRNRNNPNNRNNNIGFRVVVCAVFSRFSVYAKMSARPEFIEGFTVEALWKNGGAYPWLVFPHPASRGGRGVNQANIEEPRGLGVCPRRAAT